MTPPDSTTSNEGREFVPSRDHQLLLTAALMGGAPARGAWLAWRSRVGIEKADSAAARLLPLVYLNLAGDPGPAGRLSGLEKAYHRTRRSNQVLMGKLADAVELLKKAGIEPLVVKGAALALLHYRDLGARPMSDVDMVVRPADVRRAEEVLTELDWKRLRSWNMDAALWMQKAILLRDRDGAEIDLHWRPLKDSSLVEQGRAFRDGAVPLDIDGVICRTLCPADMLLHATVHGLRANAVPPIRWIADAHTVIRTSGPDLDWDRLLSMAQRLGYGLRLQRGLGYLARHFAAPVPEPIMRQLSSLEVSRLERLEWPFLFHTDQQRARLPLFQVLRVLMLDYLRLMWSAGRARKIVSFPRYCHYYLGMEAQRVGARSRLDLLGRIARRRLFTSRR